MRMKRLSDGAEGDVVRVLDLLRVPADTLPEAVAAEVTSGAIAPTGADTVKVTRGAAVESCGLGDHVAVIDGEAFALSERELLRGFDPV